MKTPAQAEEGQGSSPAESFREIPGLGFDAVLAVNRYGLYCVPTAFAKRKVPSILLAGGVYEPDAITFLAARAGFGDIVSGGSFIGDFFPVLSAALAPGALLHGFEPNPISHRAAQETIRLNRLTNVCLHPVGVGAKEGVFHLQVSRGETSLAAGARVVDSPSPDTIDIEVTTLDKLVPEDRMVSILHLDVENHEGPALEGAHALLKRCRPIVMLEADKPWKQRNFAKQLNTIVPEAGYAIAGVLDHNCIFVPLSGGV